MSANAAREEILGKVRAALQRRPNSPVQPVPATARVGPRTPAPLEAEIAQLFAEIEKLNGQTRRLANSDALKSALADLVKAEAVKKATLWTTPDLAAWGVAGTLKALGVEIVSPQADKHLVAECELGVTGADAALPETGTLLLAQCARSTTGGLAPAAGAPGDLHAGGIAVRPAPSICGKQGRGLLRTRDRPQPHQRHRTDAHSRGARPQVALRLAPRRGMSRPPIPRC